MSNHAAGGMLNYILGECVEKKYLDRFNEEEKDDIVQIFDRALNFEDGNFYEMIDGLEDYFGICSCCEKKVGAENLVNGTCPKCR